MKKKAKFRRRLIRAAIQLVFFLMAPAVFTSAFSGIKYIFTQIGNGEKLELVSFIVILISVCLFTILFGRFFCGFACAFGSLGDLVYTIGGAASKKSKKKLPKLSDVWVERLIYVKYLILLGIIICCFIGIYGTFAGSSPWDVFSMITALNLKTAGYGIGILLFILIIVGMVLEERFFCKFLCPMGAIFALLPILPFANLRRDRDHCINRCSACKRQCPVRLEIDGDTNRCGECIQCNKCLDVCPKGNIHSGYSRIKGNELAVVLVKAFLLMVIFLVLGCTRL